MSEKYLGRGTITVLGNTEKAGAFLVLDVESLLECLDELLEEDPSLSKLEIKVLPLKAENVTENETHSIKLK